MVSFLLQVSRTVAVKKTEDLFVSFSGPGLVVKDDKTEFTAWGDPIPGKSFESLFPQNRNVDFILRNLYGHYYFILLSLQTGQLIIGNSYFSVLPVYYYETKGALYFSDNAIRLGWHCRKTNLSPRFVLETTLFNYPLFNHSAVEGIELLQSNAYCSLSRGKLEIIKHTVTDRWFLSEPSGWRKSISETTDNFLASSQKYFPEENYFNSFTGGFDGRTLAATGLYCGRRFTSFCFGSPSSGDMRIAQSAAGEAGIPFRGIILGEDYVKNESLNNGKEFILNSSGTGTFERAHYLFASKQLSKTGSYMITGNFGSEIFKPTRIAGELISGNLFQLFRNSDPANAFKIIEASNEFGTLRRENLKSEWEELKSDIQNLPCYSPEYLHLSKIQQFYVFVFEEVFRKYFGAEMINQFNYLRNRTPFIDYDFLMALLKTRLAGIHSRFFESNPLKRLKGQVLYAEIIRKAFPLLGGIETDKGYRPDDLLSFIGKIRITQNFIKKKLHGNRYVSDPNSVLMSWNENRHFWKGLPSSSDLFSYEDETDRWKQIPNSILFRVCTINYLRAKLAGNED